MAAPDNERVGANNSDAISSLAAVTSPLADSVGFELLGKELGKELERAVKTALKSGAVFNGGTNALSVFRSTLNSSIRNIEIHPKGKLFQRFLRDGPYEGEGSIPPELNAQRLSDEETASAIAFIYSFMINSFKGAVTELFASEAIVRLIQRLRRTEAFPMDSRVYMGDTVMVHRRSGSGVLKGADAHVLILKRNRDSDSNVIIAGVVEVKSGPKSAASISSQLEKHIQRGTLGISVVGTDYGNERIRFGYGRNNRLLKISVQPSNWKLPRSFHFESSENSRSLQMDSFPTPNKEFDVSCHGDNRWHITLKWSKEAIAEVAYEMTFWFMEKVGEAIYSESRPKGWEEMSPAEAGRNATKMMLYYAILRCTSDRASQRAIALYNTYGFGYALGMNFKNAQRKREMLWPNDLDEIIESGSTKNGCRIY